MPDPSFSLFRPWTWTPPPGRSQPTQWRQPPEITDRIYSFLPPKDVGRGQGICRGIREDLAQKGDTAVRQSLLQGLAPFISNSFGLDGLTGPQLAQRVDRFVSGSFHYLDLSTVNENDTTVSRAELLSRYPLRNANPMLLNQLLTRGSVRVRLDDVHGISADQKVFIGVANTHDIDRGLDRAFPEIYVRTASDRYTRVRADCTDIPERGNSYVAAVTGTSRHFATITYIYWQPPQIRPWGVPAVLEELSIRVSKLMWQTPTTCRP